MSHLIQGIPFISQLVKYPTGCESVSAVMALRCLLDQPVSVEEFIDHYLPKGPAPSPAMAGSAPQASDQPDVPTLTGPDPWEVFPGDPYSTHGWGCFIPALKSAIEKCLKDKLGDEAAGKTDKSQPAASQFDIKEHYHLPIEELCHTYIDNDIPVIFWATIGMAKAHESLVWKADTGRIIHWMSPMHCTLLIGYRTATAEESGDEQGTAPGRITHYIFNDPTSGEQAAFPAEAVEEAYRAQGEQALAIVKMQPGGDAPATGTFIEGGLS